MLKIKMYFAACPQIIAAHREYVPINQIRPTAQSPDPLESPGYDFIFLAGRMLPATVCPIHPKAVTPFLRLSTRSAKTEPTPKADCYGPYC